MDYYCDVCDKFINPNSKYRLLKSSTHKEYDRFEHLELTIKNPNIINVDEVFYAYFMQLIKQYDHYIFKCHFNLVFNDNQNSTWSRSNLFNKKTMSYWKKYLAKVIDHFENNG